MKKMKRGDLAYIPSEVMLYQYDDNQGSLSEYIKLKKPSSAVVVDYSYNVYSVLYNGQTWCVDARHVYPLKDDQREDNYGDSKANRTF